jgi:hypothetical protein
LTNKIFKVHSLLQDPVLGFAWVAKPQTKVELKLWCLEYKIDGFFRHKNCPRIFNFGELFTNITCDACSRFPHEHAFRKMVVWEDATIVKRGAGGTWFGRRLGYLSIHKLSTHSCAICKKYWTARYAHWYQKGRST